MFKYEITRNVISTFIQTKHENVFCILAPYLSISKMFAEGDEWVMTRCEKWYVAKPKYGIKSLYLESKGSLKGYYIIKNESLSQPEFH